jgi:hypothetical protein
MRGDWQNSGKENMGAMPTTNGRSAHYLDRQSAGTSALQKVGKPHPKALSLKDCDDTRHNTCKAKNISVVAVSSQ